MLVAHGGGSIKRPRVEPSIAVTPSTVPRSSADASPAPADHARRLAAIAAARAAGTITDHSARTMRDWLTQPRYAEFAGELAARIDAQALWKELDDVYWTVIPFGTGGRRGTMYPGRLQRDQRPHDRRERPGPRRLRAEHRCRRATTPTCAIAYDTRHRSEHFARLCAEVLLAAGFRIFFLRGFRSTPELSFAVRHTQQHLRHHGDGQPQSAQRQRREGLLGRRRAGAAAARQGDHRPRDEGRRRAPRELRRGRGRRPRAVRRGGDRSGVRGRGAAAVAPRPAGHLDPLHAAARRGRHAPSCRCSTGPASRSCGSTVRTRSPTATSPTCPATWPTPRIPAVLTRPDRGGEGPRRRPRARERPRLRPARRRPHRSRVAAGQPGQRSPATSSAACSATRRSPAARPAARPGRATTSSPRS